jgi:capsular polysaccharide biosynthesis protein
MRARSRPLPVLLVAALIAGGIAFKVISKKPLVEADVTLLLTDSSLARDKTTIPVLQLREYVQGVLMPDSKLIAMIERRNLYKLRTKLGNQFALDSLRDQVEVTVWKNTYATYDEDAPNAARSARIGITVADTDPDAAMAIAHDLANIVVETHAEQTRSLAKQLAADAAAFRDGLEHRTDALNADRAEKEQQLAEARAQGKTNVVNVLELFLAENLAETNRVRKQLDATVTSVDTIADRVEEAGLDTPLTIVDEHKPEAGGTRGFVLALVLAVVGLCSLCAAALLLGAFDSRIHDGEDVTRLNLPLLGHVPGFPGDDVGSLRARGAPRRRVPSF